MPPKKRDTLFQAHHVAEFGLWICERAVMLWATAPLL